MLGIILDAKPSGCGRSSGVRAVLQIMLYGLTGRVLQKPLNYDEQNKHYISNGPDNFDLV